jgi:hypothetical protein
MDTHVAAAYATLGLPANGTASDRDVKEAYRRLVLQHHPDRAPQHARPAAEAAFVRVRQAYETLLKRSAGYSPPPPGTPPSAQSASAWWRSHAGPDGRVPWGQYNGYETEMAFYRAMVRSGRSSLLWLSAAGLLGVPVITALSMAAQSLRAGGGGGFSPSNHRRRDADAEARGWGMTAGGLRAMEEEEERGEKEQAAAAAAAEEEDDGDGAKVAVLGLDSLRADFRVNGGTSLNSPFAATSALDRHAFLERQRREKGGEKKEEGGGGGGGKA